MSKPSHAARKLAQFDGGRKGPGFNESDCGRGDVVRGRGL